MFKHVNEAKGAISDMELKKLEILKLDFESRGVSHVGKRKLVPQMRDADTRAFE